MKLALTLSLCLSVSLALPNIQLTPGDKRKTPELTDKIVRQFLLSPDGSKVDFDVLRDFAEQLVRVNSGMLRNSEHEHEAVNKYSSEANNAGTVAVPSKHLAINDYLTFQQPSKTPFLGLSSMCDICASIISVAGKVLVTDAVWPTIIGLAKSICPGLTGFSQYACDSYVDSFDPIVHYVMPTMLDSPYTLCGTIFKNMGCGKPDHQHFLWELPLPEPLAQPVPQPTLPTPPTKSKLSIMHMSDVHIDPEYQEGTAARCMEPMCCRRLSTPTHDPLPDNEKAGYWGDYRVCDLPKHSFLEILREAKQKHGADLDAIFIAGDLPPHDTWNQSAEIHSDIIDFVVESLETHFPTVPAFFAVGNHEVAPVNAYPLPGDPEQFSAQWLYDKLASVWMKNLDPNVANETVHKAGFYTTMLKPGWRLLTINDNYCLFQNFFLFGRADITDPYGVLSWMIDVLTKAELAGERVQIMGHIPPGDKDCLQAYSWNYYRIISRFSHIITGQFFGHIHKDYFIMYYDAETLLEPKGVAFVGPPGTPFSRNNIGYRIYEFDSTTFQMLDYHQYYADVDDANAAGDKTKMPWQLEYSARADYGLADMTAASWSDFAKRMQNNPALFAKYRKHYQLSMKDDTEPCGPECRRNRICQAYQGLSWTPDTWCSRWYPTKQEELDNNPVYRKCSSRFIKRPDNKI